MQKKRGEKKNGKTGSKIEIKFKINCRRKEMIGSLTSFSYAKILQNGNSNLDY